ncbi:MAG TPA: serpin family protein [Polyangiaceae bacterium]
MRHLTWFAMTLVTGGMLSACSQVTDIAQTEGTAAGTSSTLGGAGATVAGGASGGGEGPSQAGTAAIEELHSSLPPDEHPDISDAEFASFVSSANRFGLELAQAYSSLAQTGTANWVFSPNSAQVALAMTYAGAVGDAAEAMRNSLHDPFTAGRYHVASNRLLRELASRNYAGQDTAKNDVRVQLNHANSLWADRSLAVKTPFLDVLGQQYGSGLRRLDFTNQPDASRRTINDWVAQKTYDKIIDLLAPDDISSLTALVLVNALYFYGSWAESFNPASTSNQTFHTLAGLDVTVPTMHSSFTISYKASSSYTVVQLPYVQGHVRLTLVVPLLGGFESVRSAVSEAFLTEATTGLVPTSLNLALPKFTIKTEQMKLNAALTQIGMGRIFEPGGFTGITDTQIAVSSVVQKAFIGADEFGTEAAAATAVVMKRGGVAATAVNIDRPFLFFVQDESGLVLFSGHVVDPSN